MNTEANVWVRIILMMLIWLILMMKTSKAMMMYMEKFSKLPNLHCKKRNASSQEIIKWSQPRMVCEWLHVEKMHLLLRKTKDLNINWSKTLKENKGSLYFVQVRQKRIASIKWEWPSYWSLWKACMLSPFMHSPFILQICNSFQLGEWWIIWINPNPWCLLTIHLSSTLWYNLHAPMLGEEWAMFLWLFLMICVSLRIHTSR